MDTHIGRDDRDGSGGNASDRERKSDRLKSIIAVAQDLIG
jgi:hypothetical protein